MCVCTCRGAIQLDHLRGGFDYGALRVRNLSAWQPVVSCRQAPGETSEGAIAARSSLQVEDHHQQLEIIRLDVIMDLTTCRTVLAVNSGSSGSICLCFVTVYHSGCGHIVWKDFRDGLGVFVLKQNLFYLCTSLFYKFALPFIFNMSPFYFAHSSTPPNSFPPPDPQHMSESIRDKISFFLLLFPPGVFSFYMLCS